MKKLITEEHVEEHVLDVLKNLDYDIIRGSNEEYLPFPRKNRKILGF